VFEFLKKNKRERFSIFFFVGIVFFFSCENRFLPKPKGYNKIKLPKHEYYKLNNDFPFSFDVSTKAEVKNNTSYKNEPYWIDLFYPDFNAEINITYKKIQRGSNDLMEFVNDTYKLINKHQIKASSIKETIIQTPSDKKATIIELFGEVPTQFQFHITDSSSHFLRGALYFNIATKNDSLAPIINFVKIDMIHLINTLEWNE